MNPEKVTYTRREFNMLAMMFVSLFTATATGKAKTKKKPAVAAPQEIEGCKLFIDLPPDEAWGMGRYLSEDEWNDLRINPLDVSPRLQAQLEAAKAAEYGTPVLLRVLGDPRWVLLKATYYRPGDPERWVEEHPDDAWRIEYFGDGFKTIDPDNTGWWPHRLKPIKDHPDWNAWERAFAAEWEKHNTEIWNSSGGILQGLMFSTYEHEKPPAFEPWLTNRERKICATLIQWLGTNCGRGFLHAVHRRAIVDAPKSTLI